jgi:hypothetical protein
MFGIRNELNGAERLNALNKLGHPVLRFASSFPSKPKRAIFCRQLFDNPDPV